MPDRLSLASQLNELSALPCAQPDELMHCPPLPTRSRRRNASSRCIGPTTR